MFLISSRLTALALFASVMPCFIFTHFFCSWLVLLFFVWRSKTDLMDSPGGEWLYRATVGLIWYFDWFNVVYGKTRNRTLLYHGYILADISLLCGLWYWKMSTEPPYFEIPQLYAVITACSVVGIYILGLLFKVIYYKCYHPNITKEELKEDTGGQGPTRNIEDRSWPNTAFYAVSPCMQTDVVDGATPAPPVKHCNKRMRKLAENYYSWSASLDSNRIRRIETDLSHAVHVSVNVPSQDHGDVRLWAMTCSLIHHWYNHLLKFAVFSYAHCVLYWLVLLFTSAHKGAISLLSLFVCKRTIYIFHLS